MKGAVCGMRTCEGSCVWHETCEGSCVWHEDMWRELCVACMRRAVCDNVGACVNRNRSRNSGEKD